MEQFVQELPIGAALLDGELRYLAWSRAFAASYGLGDDLRGHLHADLFPVSVEPWQDGLERCLAGEPSESDDTFRHGDGTVERLRWQLRPWLDASGAVSGVLVYTETLFHERALQQTLADRDDHIDLLFEGSPIGLNLCTMEGLWVESNQAFLDIIGYSAEEADEGLTYWDLTPRSYDDEEQVQLGSLARTGRYGPYDKEFIRKDGTRVPVRLNGFIVERKGVEYIWSLIEDMTERRELERKLESERIKTIQAAKLATLGEMAAGFAHEINNPLAIIDGWAGILEQIVVDGDVELGREAQRAMSSAAQRAAKIVHGLRKFSRESQGETMERVPLAEVVADALSLCQARIRHHGVSLEVVPPPDVSVRCNPIELSQVLINLLNNAFDAVAGTDDGQIRLWTTDGEGTIELCVQDNGSGIPEPLREKVFQPFFTTKAVGKGTGLGLSISRGIVERIGGRLELRCTEDACFFVVTLPVEAS